jgi:hypothetical protein
MPPAGRTAGGRVVTVVPRRRTSLLAGMVGWGGGRLLSGLLLLLSGWGLWSMYTEPRWQVQWVEVIGCSLVPVEAVVRESGLAEAWIIGLDPEAVAARVAAIPVVVEARVEIVAPSKVRVTVVEDRPIVTLRVGEQDRWILERGDVVDPVGEVPGLPAIRIAEATWPVGVDVRRLLEGVRRLAAVFPEQPEFTYSLEHGFVIASELGFPVYLGDAGDLGRKLELLELLEDDLVRRGIRPAFVNLRTVDGAYYR